MFEKSLVDLINGLRAQKGNETEYIQNALKECRNEIRSQDMDYKATALLKLVYLEMFGYDMTWAAFNVLEVMASAKPFHKRIGYLAAVQTFRPETEVLMLAENLLKKDLGSPTIPILTLPLVTLPHIVTPSLALSMLTDLMPRLSHSHPAVRKKTLVTLYRLALVYPETLRVAWPKIKERLLDEQEDSSVTAATVNVVCELGWRRPQDFLSLAPRLFELLIGDKNNWMAIKIIKLFAVLTPLEPRLIKKLARPLTKILQETSAMSLLYEAINGIIQGGILQGGESTVDIGEVADLCITKLRGMIVLEGDPNLKYVALVAFNKIVASHPALVAMQQDVIMACLDDPDISIKMQALELVSGMVSSDNLQPVVDRLLKQLANAPSMAKHGVPEVDGENTDLEQKLIPDKRGKETAPLPDEYRHEIISRILDMCSANTYANITDFEWYIETLLHLVKYLPPDTNQQNKPPRKSSRHEDKNTPAARIGSQLIDITVRVKDLRPEAVRAAETLILLSNRTIAYASHSGGQNQILKSSAWACGEFSSYPSNTYEVLNSLIHESSLHLAPATLATFVQSIPKIIAQIVITADKEWNISRSTMMSLTLARTTDFLEKLSSHPSLEVQERSVEFLELLRLASEALSSQPKDSSQAPLLLTSAIPNLFKGMELNPVAAAAQKKVPLPDDLDLDEPINPRLASILQASQVEDTTGQLDPSFHAFYYEREVSEIGTKLAQQPNRPSSYRGISNEPTSPEPVSYQSAPESPNTRARRKAERALRNKDDPFYIPPTESSSGRSTPFHDILRQSNGTAADLDLDSIPIIDLKIEPHQQGTSASQVSSGMLDEIQLAKDRERRKKKKPARKFIVTADENLEFDSDPNPTASSTHLGHGRSISSSRATAARSQSPAGTSTGAGNLSSSYQSRTTSAQKLHRSLLSLDSSSLQNLSLEDPDSSFLTAADLQRREAEEAEMVAALREVERKRLEMQRQIEKEKTSIAQGVDVEGTVVKRKIKKKKKVASVEAGEDELAEHTLAAEGDAGAEPVRKKKKKRRVVKTSEQNEDGDENEGGKT